MIVGDSIARANAELCSAAQTGSSHPRTRKPLAPGTRAARTRVLQIRAGGTQRGCVGTHCVDPGHLLSVPGCIVHCVERVAESVGWHAHVALEGAINGSDGDQHQ